MASRAPEEEVLDSYETLVIAFTEFLTVAIHLILYERDLYPRDTFLSTRKYNYPERQNRHPAVCEWIADAVAAVEVEMMKVRIIRPTVSDFHLLKDPNALSIQTWALSFGLTRQCDILITNLRIKLIACAFEPVEYLYFLRQHRQTHVYQHRGPSLGLQ